ncbi:partitioning defective 3 homolog isoform X2 [Condylostylus longicornis]|uniref:partitioning defective 3 homolog isoform X2 n=1 Tax=Condylostylus longicornis TaxID=2530218 RepID=UPI00244DBD31|nr:partitioning defective 3 homolog isoform X2 [Condylostylus longicornis]
MFDIPPKCPALADKLTGIFGWRATYRVSQKHKGLQHTYLQKSYSMTLPSKGSNGSFCKEPDSWVAVHHLQTQSGILDPDDCIGDVADDREQILASFEDSGPDPGVQQGGGDGASGSSSVGTGSPDIFRDPTNQDAATRTNASSASTPHIEVTSTTSNGSHTGLGLQVRRSSDPSLIQTLQTADNVTNKRWSAAAPACGSESAERILDKVGYLSPQWEEEDDAPHSYTSMHNSLTTPAFARSGRLSMQFLGDGSGYKWMEAAEKLQHNHLPHHNHHNHHNHHTSPYSSYNAHNQQIFTSKSLPRESSKRKEPLGQAYESIREGEMLLITNEYGGKLGLTAIPDREFGGLLVQFVEPGSRAEQGRLRKGDRILEINGNKLVGLAEDKVQEYLRKSLTASELRVRVIRANKLCGHSRKDSKVSEMVEVGEKSVGTKVATVSPTKKIPGAQVGTSLQVANTRKLGKKIEIVLKKGPQGLGFSLTARDNPAGGHCPIYIKTILPRGAAIEDGRLKPGDRLLEVDGLQMDGKSQADAVALFRAIQPGSTVKIIVSRQQELADAEEKEIMLTNEEIDNKNSSPPKPPAPVFPNNHSNSERQMASQANANNSKNDTIIGFNISNDQHFIDGGNESAASTDSIQPGSAWRHREVLTLHIPVHDTEKAGLGVSVKGKTTSANSSSGSNKSMKHDGDLGIFVKNVIHGGAASRDGRLRMNDQLLSVNGVSLLGQNNAEAMETLRRAMLHIPAKHPGVITLTVARKIARSQSSGDIIERESLQESRETLDSSNNSENSGATVIYLSPDKKEKQDSDKLNNPLLERLSSGIYSSTSKQRPSTLYTHGLRNDSYFMATNDSWTPMKARNDSVFMEDEPEPPLTPNPCDATYSSQLSLDTNTSAEAFSRDAIGRRSISEKHHAALDARETGTYQRNKKLREERERERRLQLTKSAYISGSIESLAKMANELKNRNGQSDLTAEALDKIGELGPSLGLKKSSSLESLQTMVQEIQMSEDIRTGPSALKAPRGRGREDSLRAAVVSAPDKNKPRKHWLLEDGGDSEGGFSHRNGPFQSSLNDGKSKSRAKKPSILRGIGHMFRFGKHRKDGVMPVEANNEFTSGLPPQLPSAHKLHQQQQQQHQLHHNQQHHQHLKNTEHQQHSNNQHQRMNGHHVHNSDNRPKDGPPIYQPPPPPNGIHQPEIFTHRYQHYVNFEELQHQISEEPNDDDVLSESILESMRRQVMIQRNKVELESRRHQHYHSQRSARSQDINFSPTKHQHLQQQQQTQLHNYPQIQAQIGGRPISSYYEYETVQHNVTPLSGSGRSGKFTSPPQRSSPSKNWKSSTLNGFQQGNLNGSGRSRGPFITHVQIRDQSQIITTNGNSISTGQNNSNQNLRDREPLYNMKPTPQPHASKV